MKCPAIAGVGLAAIALACGEPKLTPTPPVSRLTRPTRSELSAAINTRLSSRLNAAGQFVFPDAGGPSTITSARAIVLAEVWRMTMAQYLVSALERERGAPIALDALKPDSRVFVARAPYQIAADAPKPARNAFSDYYLVQYHDQSGLPVMSVAVSVLATDISIVDGRLVFPTAHGNEFFATGISPQASDGVPFSPERAAVLAHEMTGAMVSDIPELVEVGMTSSRARGAPQYSVWHLRLDHDVPLATEKAASLRDSHDLYFDHHGRPLMAAADQPADIPVLLGSEQRGAAPTQSRLTRLASTPVEFDLVIGTVRP
jgi:hypothetical protein